MNNTMTTLMIYEMLRQNFPMPPYQSWIDEMVTDALIRGVIQISITASASSSETPTASIEIKY